MTTKICPKFLIFVNAVFALAAIGLTAYKTPASFLNKQTFLPSNNVFNQRPIQEQPYNQAIPEIFQCRDFRGHGGRWGYGRYGRMYNVKTVETVRGKVVSVDAFIPRRGMSHGVHLQVETQKGIIPVHLGPAWYIENQEITIKPEDKVEIKGYLINFARKPAIIAAEVKKGNMTLVLRSEDGFPMWSGWRRNQVN
ncbi:MAG: hypothetical protein WBA39_16710 [Rivularia sp. (in: cyanobacteria)]